MDKVPVPEVPTPTGDLTLYLRLSYLAAAAAILVAYSTPPLRRRFLAYGPRLATTSRSPDTNGEISKGENAHENGRSDGEKEPNGTKARSKSRGAKGHRRFSTANYLEYLRTWLDWLADFTVPHDWFLSFYFASVTLSAFWPGEVLYLKGPLYRLVADSTTTRGVESSMTFPQLQVVWAMLFVQGGRRLYECLVFPSSNSESSVMWVGHWVLGMTFYAVTSVAIWIEGIPVLRDHHLSYRDLAISAPSFRTIVAVLLFILASGFQHDCHAYLAHLRHSKPEKSEDEREREKQEEEENNKKKAKDKKKKKDDPQEEPQHDDNAAGAYKLPTHPAFAQLIAPHYTAECVIYMSFALVAAPRAALLNWTLTAALVFVVMNLGVTADGSRKWYRRRFGKEAVAGKWRMIPYVW